MIFDFRWRPRNPNYYGVPVSTICAVNHVQTYTADTMTIAAGALEAILKELLLRSHDRGWGIGCGEVREAAAETHPAAAFSLGCKAQEPTRNLLLSGRLYPLG